MKTFVCFTLACVFASLGSAQDAKEPTSSPGISVIKFVAPTYRKIAQVARITGDVRVLVEIAPDGTARNVTVLSGHPMLVQAATEAVKQWKFGCQRCEQPLRIVVTIRFVIDERLGDCTYPVHVKVEPALPALVIVRAGAVCVQTMNSY